MEASWPALSATRQRGRGVDWALLHLLVATSVAFIATNVDSFVVLYGFSGSARPLTVFVSYLVVGCAVVVASLVVGSAIAALRISPRFFAAVPLCLGLWQAVRRCHLSRRPEQSRLSGGAGLIPCLLSCSIDNIAVYGAMLLGKDLLEVAIVTGVLASLYAMCGWMAASSRARARFPGRGVGGWLAPAAAICVGVARIVA